MPERFCQAGIQNREWGAACSGKQIERRTRQYFKGHHSGCRVSREAEEKRLTQSSEYDRLARLNQHPVEVKLRAEICEHTLHKIVLARGHPARKQNQVAAESLLQQIARSIIGVRSNWQHSRKPAGALDLSRQRVRVRVPDLIRRRSTLHSHEFVPRSDNADAGLTNHVHVRGSNGCKCSHSAEIDPRSAPQRDASLPAFDSRRNNKIPCADGTICRDLLT